MGRWGVCGCVGVGVGGGWWGVCGCVWGGGVGVCVWGGVFVCVFMVQFYDYQNFNLVVLLTGIQYPLTRP